MKARANIGLIVGLALVALVGIAKSEIIHVSVGENGDEEIQEDVVIPEAQEAFREAALDWDVKAPNGTQLESVETGDGAVAVPEEISTPTLIIYGARDGAYEGHRVADFFARLNNHDKELIVLPDSGHFLFIQKPRVRFFKAVAEFFNQG